MALAQGDRVSESVPLPSGWCSPNDYLRAFVCAEAVLCPQNSDIEAFLRGIQEEVSFIEFGDIHVSLDLNPDYGFKFLVADAADAIFIAFQVSQNFNNSLGSALCNLPSGGEVDSAVFTLSHDFLGDDLEILKALYISREGKRIVLCGHEFGGALAHMVVLQFCAPLYKSGDKVHKDLSGIISITFGAPYICSSAYAEEVNRHNELKSHFFDFVLKHDPRRSILCDYDCDAVSTENAGRGGSLEGGRAGIGNGVADHENDVECNRKATIQENRARSSDNLQISQEPKFFPIGENTVLKVSKLSSSNPRSRDTFLTTYKSTLLELAGPTSTSKPSDPNSKLVLRVTTPTPVIKSAILKAMDSGRFVHVEGSNLLFLREPVKMYGLNHYICKGRTDNELYLFEPPQTDVKREGNDMENALTFIALKTAFGEASHFISENNMSGGPPTGVRRLLFKIVQTFMALASAPALHLTQIPDLLDDLDSIVQCVPHLKDGRLSDVLRDIAEGTNQEKLKKNINKSNTMVKEVVEFLTRSCIIEYEHPLPVSLGGVLGFLLMLGGLALLPVSGIIYVLSGVAPLLTTGSAAAGAGLASTTMAFCMSKTELLIPDYRAVLEIAIQEAKLWHDGRPTSQLPERTEVALESLLLEEVEGKENHLTDMMKSIHKSGAEAQKIVFRSPTLKGATSKSKGNLLRRMQIVTKTLHMYNTNVKGIRFVGVVGAEDAGKSTFIRKAIEHSRQLQKLSPLPASELPAVGFKCHTTTVKAYKLGSEENLYLVDFPGTNGTGAYADAWKQFTSLPSSCVLLLEFQDDIKKDQVEMYKKMKHDLGSKVSVVFNKVDEKFTLRREAAYNAEYFEKQRNSTAEMLECDRKDVHFACLDPDPEEKLIKLKKVGVLDFEELFKRVV